VVSTYLIYVEVLRRFHAFLDYDCGMSASAPGLVPLLV
jgi:hypothetical protein